MPINEKIPPSRFDCEKMLTSEMDPQVLVALVKGISAAYQEAQLYSSSFAREISGYQFGQSLWGQVYQQLKGVAERYKNEIGLRVLRVEGNNFPYIELRTGLLLTKVWRTGSISEVIDQEEVNDWISKSAQNDLFSEPHQFGGLTPFYAALTHGVDSTSPVRSKPGHIAIGFPDADVTRYLHQFNLITLGDMRQPQLEIRAKDALQVERLDIKPKKKINE